MQCYNCSTELTLDESVDVTDDTHLQRGFSKIKVFCCTNPDCGCVTEVFYPSGIE